MCAEWKYYVWKVKNMFCKLVESSPPFVLFDRKYKLTLELYPCENTLDDLYKMRIESASRAGCTGRMNLATTAFVQDINGDIRFVQKVSLKYIDCMNNEEIWKINRLKFLTEINVSSEDESTPGTVTFICVFGPVGAYLKDGMNTRDIPMLGAIHPIPITSSYESLSSDLTKLLETKSLSDVVINCDGKSFSAHKAILSARSNVFRAMFQHNMSEDKEGIVNITDIDGTTFDQFLHYVYSGKLPIFSHNSAPLLYKAGDKYAVESLKKESATYIMQNLKTENACDLLLLADSHSDEEFKASVISFITDHKNGVMKQKIWHKFHREHPNLSLEVYDACIEGVNTPETGD